MTARAVLAKSVVTHTVTYFGVGVAAYFALDYASIWANELHGLVRPTTDPWIVAGPLLQPVRGLMFGIVFHALREPFFGRERGWLLMWLVLVVVGVLGTFGATPGSMEGMIYLRVPISVQIGLLPEVLMQSLLLSGILFHWVRHPGSRWTSRGMAVAFVLVVALSAAGLVSTLGAEG